jgi:hypothetical protein
MDSLKNIISDIHVFLYGGFQKLPLVIAGTLLVLGLFTANYASMFFLLGFLVLVPVLVKLLNYPGSFLVAAMPGMFRSGSSDICNVVIPFSTMQSSDKNQNGAEVFSIWLAMAMFFAGYLFTNGLELYKREGTQVDPSLMSNAQIVADVKRKENTRKSQALVAMALILLFGFGLIIFRMRTGCETFPTVLLTTFVFSILGYSWYRFLGSVGEDRLSDLFGIANRILPFSAFLNCSAASP